MTFEVFYAPEASDDIDQAFDGSQRVLPPWRPIS